MSEPVSMYCSCQRGGMIRHPTCGCWGCCIRCYKDRGFVCQGACRYAIEIQKKIYEEKHNATWNELETSKYYVVYQVTNPCAPPSYHGPTCQKTTIHFKPLRTKEQIEMIDFIITDNCTVSYIDQVTLEVIKQLNETEPGSRLPTFIENKGVYSTANTRCGNCTGVQKIVYVKFLECLKAKKLNPSDLVFDNEKIGEANDGEPGGVY